MEITALHRVEEVPLAIRAFSELRGLDSRTADELHGCAARVRRKLVDSRFRSVARCLMSAASAARRFAVYIAPS